MARHGDDAPGAVALRERLCVEDVGQLALPVAGESARGGKGRVGEVDPERAGGAVALGGDVDDAHGVGGGGGCGGEEGGEE